MPEKLASRGTAVAALPLRALGDAALAHLAASGNQAAFTTIYERHHSELYRYCRSITRDEEDARDALQTTMLNAFVALRGQAGGRPRQLRPWLFRIARNESISLLRRRPPTSELEPDAAGAADPAPEVRERLAELLADLRQLSERRRSALLLRELSGLSYDEIATALGCSPAAARQSVYEARAALTDLAEAAGSSCDEVRRKISDGDRRLLRARRVRAHLRECAECRRFDAAFRTRRAGLASLFPALPAGPAAGILQGVLGGGSGAATAGTATGSLAGAGATGGSLLAGAGLKGLAAGAATIAAAGAIAVDRVADRPADPGGAPAVAATGQPAPGATTGAAASATRLLDAVARAARRSASTPAAPPHGARAWRLARLAIQSGADAADSAFAGAPSADWQRQASAWEQQQSEQAAQWQEQASQWEAEQEAQASEWQEQQAAQWQQQQEEQAAQWQDDAAAQWQQQVTQWQSQQPSPQQPTGGG